MPVAKEGAELYRTIARSEHKAHQIMRLIRKGVLVHIKKRLSPGYERWDIRFVVPRSAEPRRDPDVEKAIRGFRQIDRGKYVTLEEYRAGRRV